MKFMFSLEPSDWIGIVDIIVTSIIGVWIGLSFQKSFTTNRAVKDFFINENVEIKTKYKQFIEELYLCKLSSNQIIEWLKIMTIRLNTFEGFVQNEYRIRPDILACHNNLKYFLTGLDEFNAQYKSNLIIFAPKTKDKILAFHIDLSNDLTKTIININRAKRKWFCKNKYGQRLEMNNSGC